MVEREREMEAVAKGGKVESLDLGSCWVCEMWRWESIEEDGIGERKGFGGGSSFLR